MHFGFNNQFVKVIRTLAKILFCLSCGIREMTLYVRHVRDMKFFLWPLEQLTFTHKINNLLIEEGFFLNL
jgi:hypothetical protein